MADEFMSNAANHNGSAAHTNFPGRLTRLLPLSHPDGLPVHVARAPAAPFCETPAQRMASGTDALQLSREPIRSIRHVYVHIPFCARICPYCAFYKDLLDRSQTWRFCEAILGELEYQGMALSSSPRRRSLSPTTIYFGGGTPTALTTEQLECLLGGFRERFDLSHLEEWTMEANPGSVSARKAALLRRLGITRLSLGVQSWDDDLLQLLGREHSAAQAAQSFHLLRGAGFTNINID